MAKNRYVSTKFWGDNYIDTLQLDEKLLFLYAITNEGLDLCGIYEFNLKVACVLTGISLERIVEILKKFEKDKKMKFEQGWLALKNFQKYQNTKNQSIKDGIKRSLEAAPVALKEWVDNNDIIPQNKNGDDERGTSGIPEVDERGTSGCTLLNFTLLNSTSPNLTELNSRESGENENEESDLSVTESPTHKGISFSSFSSSVENSDEMFTFLVDRYLLQRPDLDKHVIKREFKKFIAYWSEKNPGGKKERWEKETVFDVSRRLTTWFSRVKLTQEDKDAMEREKTKRMTEYYSNLSNNKQNG